MKRSWIITLALIAAIAVPLCASSGWARGLGVLALVGGDEALGPELVLNSMFSSNSVANWAGTNATVSSTNNELIVNSTNYGSALGSISGSLTQGAQYKLTIKIVSNSGGATVCGVKAGATTVISQTAQTGVFTGYVSSFSNVWEGVRVFVGGAATGVCTVDDVSMRRVL